MRARLAWAMLLAASVWLSLEGCRKPDPVASLPARPLPQAGPSRYPLHGTILGIGAETAELTVRHDAVVGFMPAMTMNFKLADAAQLKTLRIGDEISATLVVPEGAESYRVEKISVLSHGNASTLQTLPAHTLLVGEKIPDVALTNQDGKAVRLSSYRGQVLLLTFIYTRCPMPTACPMISSHFARVHALLAADAKLHSRSHLLSITLDPAYDTAPVLRNYGMAYLGEHPEGFAAWEFARTEPADLKQLAAAFGFEYRAADNQIVHTVRTVMVGADGRLLRTWDGSSWKPQEVADAVLAAASAGRK